MNCNYIKQDCEVEIFYKNVTLSGTSSIFVDLREYSSYASAISLNITCSSSIPDQISSVFSSIRPTSGSSIFRGLEPSVFSFELTPSVSFIKVFTSQSSEWNSYSTGYHISKSFTPVYGQLDDQKS